MTIQVTVAIKSVLAHTPIAAFAKLARGILVTNITVLTARNRGRIVHSDTRVHQRTVRTNPFVAQLKVQEYE